MSEQKQKTILISAVGKTDPFSVPESETYGPALAISLKYHPEKIYLLVSKQIEDSGRYEAFLNEIKYYLPQTIVEKIGKRTFEGEVANSKAVFEFVKPYLSKIFDLFEDSTFLINVTSGTPQIQNLFKVIASLQTHRKCNIIQVKRERTEKGNNYKEWKHYSINKKVKKLDRKFQNYIEEVTGIESEINYFTFITSLDVLIGNYEYFAAIELADILNKKYSLVRKNDLKIFINFCKALHSLQQLNIEEARAIFGSSKQSILRCVKEKEILNKYINEKQYLSKSRINIALKVCEQKIKKENYAETIKLIAVLRELILIEIVSNVINKGKQVFERLTRSSLEEKNKSLLEFLDKEVMNIKSSESENDIPVEGRRFRDQQKLTVWTASKIIKFKNEVENEYQNLSTTIDNCCEKLIKKRNSISHKFSKVTKDDFENAITVKNNLLNIANHYNLHDKDFPDVFDIFNKRLKEYMRRL